MNFLSDVSELSVHYCFISAGNVGGLVSVSDWEGVLQESDGNSVFSYKGPVYTVDLGPRVNDHGGVDVFHSKRRDDEFHFYVQGVLSSRGTMNGNGEFLRRSGSPFQKS